jgi:lysophospholipase L1-like esterase
MAITLVGSMSEYVQNDNKYIIDDPTIAPVFVESTAYAAGQYVKHQGNLYKLTASHAANTTWANTSKTQVLVESEMRTMQGDTSALQNALEQHEEEYNDFSMRVLNDAVLSNDFVYGRYLSGGFANVTSYARSRLPYAAGKYEIGPITTSNGFMAVEYISDTQGNELFVNFVSAKQTITPTRPWYIRFSAITGDENLSAINSGFVVRRISTEEETLQDMVEAANDSINSKFELEYSKNRYDGTYTVGGGYVVPTTGEIGSSSNYSPSGWINISNHGDKNVVYSQKYNFANYAMRYAFYDSQKTYITGALIDGADVAQDGETTRWYIELETPENAAFMRFSMVNGAFTVTPSPDMQIEYEEVTAYSEYTGDQSTIKTSALENNELIIDLMNQSGLEYGNILQSMTYGKQPPQATQTVLSNGETLAVENNSVMKNQYISFVANINSEFGSVIVGHGQESYGYFIKVDGTNMTYGSNGSFGTAVPHGLTISEFIGVFIEVDVGLNIKTTIVTKSGWFTRTQQINSSWRGDVFATSELTTFNNAVLTWNTDDYKCPLWAFGDSYFTLYSPTRWPYYIAKQWGFNNILLNAYPGEASDRAYNDLVTALLHGTPKYLLWCLGMNDPDTTSAANATWLAKVQAIKEMCDEKGITLILATIPIVTNPSYRNDYKNAWIRSSGIRYVDFAAALANINGWLSDDGVHPNEIGGRFMALKLLSDVPEITQGK